MFTYPNEYGKKAEELLWRKVYYDVIHAVKNGRKVGDRKSIIIPFVCCFDVLIFSLSLNLSLFVISKRGSNYRLSPMVFWLRYFVSTSFSLQFQSNAPGALQQRHLVPHYQQFLYSAVGYYQYLLLKMQSKVRPGLVDMDCSLASRPLRDSARHRLDKSNKVSIYFCTFLVFI